MPNLPTSDFAAERDSRSGLKMLWKYSYEERLLNVDCAPKMRAGDTIAAFTSATPSRFGLVAEDAPNMLVIDTLSHDSKQTLQFKAKKGVDGERYLLVLKFTTSQGETLEADVALAVEDVDL